MRRTILQISLGCLLLGFWAHGQTFVTNRLNSAQASKVASSLTVGMSEWTIYDILRSNGLTGMTIGNTFSGKAFYLLSDGCYLDLYVDVKPGTMTNRLLQSAWISSNDVETATIRLKEQQ